MNIEHVCIDAQRKAKEHPETFQAPCPMRLGLLRPGDSVKICAEGKEGGERFWVEVLGINGKKILGSVANDLICGHEFDFGTHVEFEMRHIYDTLLEGES